MSDIQLGRRSSENQHLDQYELEKKEKPMAEFHCQSHLSCMRVV
jgi:hypothetical protein